MEALEIRLRRRIYVSLYALLFLTILLVVSVLLEGCSDSKNKTQNINVVGKDMELSTILRGQGSGPGVAAPLNRL